MTKNNPGKFDCYSKAEPDEPMFVLLARDPAARATIEAWISTRKEMGYNEPEKIREAINCAYEMERWRAKFPQKDQIIMVLLDACKVALTNDSIHTESVREGTRMTLRNAIDYAERKYHHV